MAAAASGSDSDNGGDGLTIRESIRLYEELTRALVPGLPEGSTYAVETAAAFEEVLDAAKKVNVRAYCRTEEWGNLVEALEALFLAVVTSKIGPILANALKGQFEVGETLAVLDKYLETGLADGYRWAR